MLKLNKLFKKSVSLSSDHFMHQHFKEMMRFLARTKLNKASAKRLRELPWYLVVGARNSGKTNLLSQSELDYILQKRSKSKVSTQSKTQQPEWWATREAVMVDVPGQFWQAQTQEQQATWHEFLKLIQQHRCPLAGIVVTLSAEQLTTHWNKANKQQYRNLAKRLGQLANAFKQPSRCYLVITHMDTVPGFTDYFATLDAQQRQQPWGFDCPHQTKEPIEQIIAAQFQAFVTRLHQAMVPQLHRQRDPAKRDRLQRFPSQLEQCQAALFAWAKQCYTSFSSNSAMHFAGIYFTSSQQSETKTLEESDEVSQRFELQAYKPMQQNYWKSQSYFVTNFFKQVVFNSSTTIKVKSSWHSALSARVAIMLMAFILLAGTSFYLYQFQARFRSIAAIQQTLNNYEMIEQQLADKSSEVTLSDITRTIRILHQIQQAVIYFSHQTDSWFTPLHTRSLRYDLKINSVYQKAMERTLIPQLLALSERDLKVIQFTQSMSGKLTSEHLIQAYQSAQVYLMLLQPKYLKGSVIESWLLAKSDDKQQQNTFKLVSKLLHEKALKQWPHLHQVISLAQIQSWFKPYRVADLIYLQMKQAVDMSAIESQPLLGSYRSRFNEESQQLIIPGLFLPSQRTAMFALMKTIIHHVYEGPWMIHQLHLTLPKAEHLEQQVLAHYWQDYISVWQSMLAKLKLQPFHSLQQAALMLEQFADQKQSPLYDLSARMTKALSLATEQNDQVLVEEAMSWESTLSAIQKVQQQLATMAHRTNTAKSAYEYARKRLIDPSKQEALAALREMAETSSQPTKKILLELVEKSWQVILENASRYLNAVWITRVYPFYAERLSGRYPLLQNANQEITLSDFTRFFGPRRYS